MGDTDNRDLRIKGLIKQYENATDDIKMGIIGQLSSECQREFHQLAFDFLVTSMFSEKERFEFVKRTAKEIIEISFVLKDQTIISDLLKKTITRLNLEMGTKYQDDRYEYRIQLLNIMTILGKKEEKVAILLKRFTNIDFEKISNVREKAYQMLNEIDPHKNLDDFLNGLMFEQSDAVKGTINLILRTRFGEKIYLWSQVKSKLTLDVIRKIIINSNPSIKEYFIETIGKNAQYDRKKDLEKLFLEILRAETENFKVREKATEMLGYIGRFDSFIELYHLIESNNILKNAAEKGISIFATRKKIPIEKLVEEYILKYSQSKIFLTFLSYIFGVLTIISSFLRIILSNNPNQVALKAMNWGALIFATLTFGIMIWLIWDYAKIGIKIHQTKKRYDL